MRRVRWLLIAGRRLVLRELKEADTDAVQEYSGDPDVVRFMD